MEQHRCILERESSVFEAMKYILALQGREQMVIVTFLWLWWLERNSREGVRRKSVEVAFMCQQYAAEYLGVCKKNTEPVQVAKHMWKLIRAG